ncbi:Molybdopterin binding protein [Exidia glandulosa HHB12029]|uniref:Molybdopterin binding protein n=1 Tax=Exidia glandulosa HHB12029 TaxID=1314781 RepID=A0A165MAY8_EXIGL|nr:Molybdopterin binding protein [Exidia glandulosa HHB12029]
MPSPSPPPPTITFPRSPVPSIPARPVQTAAALMIGDEILNGKTQDTNSHHFALRCFELGIELKRIEVIPDDEAEIVEAARRLTADFDFVITSGGIGPTHDDITYPSLARAFNQDLAMNDEVLSRMAQKSMYRKEWLEQQTDEQRTARERMALFPSQAEVLFVTDDLWVPVVRLEGKLCVLPGVPSLFRRLLDNLMESYIPLPAERPFRHMVFTTLPESSIAPFLTELQRRVKGEGVRIGSYPSFQKGVTVSLIGNNEARVRELGEEVCKEIHGTVVVKDA